MMMFILGFCAALAIVLGIALFLLAAVIFAQKQKKGENRGRTGKDNDEYNAEWDV